MKTLILTLIISLTIANLFSQTYFQGGIYTDTQWTRENSPYIITGDIALFPDKTLTIQPGVEIRFDGYFVFEIRGILNSIGTDSSSIVYTSNLVNHTKGDWVGIKIKNNQGARASFEYCDFSFAEYATSVECCWEGGPIYFKNCTFDNNIYAMIEYTGYVIEVDSCKFTNNTYCITGASKHVTNSTFIGNDYGLYETTEIDVSNSTFSQNKVALYGGRGLIENSTIYENGIAVKAFFGWTEGFEIRNNIIENNDTALILSSNAGHYLPVKNNQICNNDINVINADGINKDLTGNCWCTLDSTTIEEKLIDGYDDILLGLFNYDIYDDDCEIKLKQVYKFEPSSLYPPTIDNTVNLYPNPFLSNLHIDLKSPESRQVSISIYTLYGQEIFSHIYYGSDINLQLEDLNSGIYMCVIKTGALIINRKLIKK